MSATRVAHGALARHVLRGLRLPQKALSSAWLYDDAGSMLFEQIMALPDYYLTRAEARLLEAHADTLADWMAASGRPFELLEMGSGNGAKTLVLARALAARPPVWTYWPLDLSAQALAELQARFAAALPDLPVRPQRIDYLRQWPEADAGRARMVLFMGSNLGNFTLADASALLARVRGRLCNGDGLLLGIDLQKAPRRILRAYDDSQGVTARFNLNLLARLNRELGMDFDLARFSHYACYNPLDGAALSFLVSDVKQRVRSCVLDCTFDFAQGETIHTELSQKYRLPQLEEMARDVGFLSEFAFVDAQDAYALLAWRAQ